MKSEIRDRVELRLLNASDSIEEVNFLLKASYKALADEGMTFAASHEDSEATRKRISEGECHIAILDGKIIACAILRGSAPVSPDKWMSKRPAWYDQQNVASFGRFAVSPELQGQGIGALLMDRLEARALELGCTELALDTADRAVHLIHMYEKRGYRHVGTHQWSITNYQSVVLSKTLVERPAKGPTP